jgi:hypothetical protein
MRMDPVRRERTRSTLIIVILITIPCYLLGLITLWITNGVKVRGRVTATVTQTSLFQFTSTSTTLPGTPTLFTPMLTETGTKRPTFTPTNTFIIPTRTASPTPELTETPRPTSTPTPTEPIPPTDTAVPTETPTTGPEGS